MRSWRVHKTRGTCKIVVVEADLVEFRDGCLIFLTMDNRVVMAYAPWAWKTVWEMEK